MTKIDIQSPTRVDLAGGTLDLWPLYNFIGGAPTINVAIDIMTRAQIEELPGTQIELISHDLNLERKFRNIDECLKDSDKKLHLLQVQLSYWRPTKGFRLTTSSQSPVGGGLGGSSSLTISLLKAFEKFCGRPFASTYERVQVAHNIEAEVLNTPTGTQDYFPADTGGINILNFSFDKTVQEILDFKSTPLDTHFMLVYTGKAHHSGINNFEVMQLAVKKDPQTIQSLKDLKVVAEETVKAVRAQAWGKLPELFNQEFKARVRLCPAFSSPEIEKLQQLTLNAGAEAVKICGAGGGGCVLVWVPLQNREKVAQACQSAGFQVLNAKPVPPRSFTAS